MLVNFGDGGSKVFRCVRRRERSGRREQRHAQIVRKLCELRARQIQLTGRGFCFGNCTMVMTFLPAARVECAATRYRQSLTPT